jgi:hypothetical protein
MRERRQRSVESRFIGGDKNPILACFFETLWWYWQQWFYSISSGFLSFARPRRNVLAEDSYHKV